MKKGFAKVFGQLALFVLALSCSEKPQSSALRQKFRAVALKDIASNQLFLQDVAQSAAEDETAGGNPASDAGVSQDTAPSRIQQMVSQLFAQGDADGSGTLSLQEFLLVKNFAGNVSAQKQAKIEAKLTAQFNRFAGNDAQLSEAETADLLLAQKERVGKFRSRNFPNQSATRAKSAEELMQQFDENGDGVIDLAELQKLSDALKGKNVDPNAGQDDDGAIDQVVEEEEVVQSPDQAGAEPPPAQDQVFPPADAGNNGQCVGGPKFDPAGEKNVGNGRGLQFIGGQCLSSADCASGCCANPCGICSGPGAQFQNGKQGCGFGD